MRETRWAWTERGDLAAVFHADGSTTRYLYDGERRLTEIQGPGGRTTGRSPGAASGASSRGPTPSGAIVRYRYNREGELVEVINELGEVHRLRRDGGGLVVA